MKEKIIKFAGTVLRVFARFVYFFRLIFDAMASFWLEMAARRNLASFEHSASFEIHLFPHFMLIISAACWQLLFFGLAFLSDHDFHNLYHTSNEIQLPFCRPYCHIKTLQITTFYCTFWLLFNHSSKCWLWNIILQNFHLNNINIECSLLYYLYIMLAIC